MIPGTKKNSNFASEDDLQDHFLSPTRFGRVALKVAPIRSKSELSWVTSVIGFMSIFS